MLSLILLVFALVLFVVSGVAPEPWRWRLLCFGLACLAGADLVSRSPLLR